MTEPQEQVIQAEALKPCPLCGGNELSHGYVAGGGIEWGTCGCEACDLQVTKGTEAEAIAAWNRRLHTPEAGERDVELANAARAVLESAERPGSRGEYGIGEEGEIWHDYQEVGQPALDRLARALSSPPVKDASKQAFGELLLDYEALVDAAEPFARTADEHDRADIRDSDIYHDDLTFGDLRRVRLVLARTKAPGNG